jgi:hypothetical protein
LSESQPSVNLSSFLLFRFFVLLNNDLEACGYLRDHLSFSDSLYLLEIQKNVYKYSCSDPLADARALATDLLAPVSPTQIMPLFLGKALIRSMLDRSGKVRDRSAATLRSWGAQRLETVLQLPDWRDMLKIGCKEISPIPHFFFLFF